MMANYDNLSGVYSASAIFGFLGIIIGTVAIILAVIALKSGRSKAATAGLVLGIIGVVLGVITTMSCVCMCAGAQKINSISNWLN